MIWLSVIVSLELPHELQRHKRRDDDSCRATYSPGRTARAIAADVLRRVVAPGRPLYCRLLTEADERLAKINRTIQIAQQIVTASRGYIEQSSRADPYTGDDLQIYLSRSLACLHHTVHISTYSNSITLERVELPLPVMLQLVDLITRPLEERRAAAPAQEDHED